MIVRGQEVKIASPRDAIALGIGMVHQHFVLVDPFTVTENIILGDEGGAILDLDEAQRRVRELADTYGFQVRPEAVIEELSVGEEQRVEILKALYRGVEILILDEPTAVLTPGEAKDLFEQPAGAAWTPASRSSSSPTSWTRCSRSPTGSRCSGAARWSGETTPAETSKAKLAEMMVGRPVLFRLEKPQVELGEPILRVEGLEAPGKLNGLSLEVRAGEILGVAGVEGNGQRELAEALIGLRARRGRSRLVGGRRDHRAVRGGHPQRRRRLHPRGSPRSGSGARHDPVGERGARAPRRRRVLERSRRPVHREDQRAGGSAGEALRRSHPQHRRVGLHALRRQPAEADPGPGARDGSEAADRRAAHARARRRRDRVRLEADLGPEGGRARRAPDLGRARRDLRVVGPDRDALRGPHHRRVPAGCRAGGRRGRACSAAPRPRWRADGHERHAARGPASPGCARIGSNASAVSSWRSWSRS